MPIDEKNTKLHQLTEKYRPYLNYSYIKTLNYQNAEPVVMISMPVIVIAALILASFMVNHI